MSPHRWRCLHTISVGAYVLGALEPAEHDQMVQHLRHCASCRDEVADVAPLPGFLDRLRPARALEAGGAPPPFDVTSTVRAVSPCCDDLTQTQEETCGIPPASPRPRSPASRGH
jgi:hypothetical protein